ncbi:uncharacterized protein LOC115634455 isoform X2 [Scaptodrosophila lebanonensis]|uniref:Uncharacterized protein LOC115634455 isoform X2 n=1 Tax=Drosophila lebanonensis TaxID=7225 RepID=A0A6J2UKP5_DROLE|nr:uncharacterized protein LOC115634455 isoform X2 [Scaptodrosophila lebanonensis]
MLFLCINVAKTDWSTALQICQENGLCLADLNKKEHFSILTWHLQGGDRTEYWFGLNHFLSNSLKYVGNNLPVRFIPESGNTDTDGNRQCGYIKPVTDSFTIAMADCSEKKRFICAESIACNSIHTNSTYSSGYFVWPSCNWGE